MKMIIDRMCSICLYHYLLFIVSLCTGVCALILPVVSKINNSSAKESASCPSAPVPYDGRAAF